MSSPAKVRNAARIRGENSPAGDSCRKWLESFSGLRRDGGQPPSPVISGRPLIWRVQGRHKGEERVPRFCLREIGSGTGGTWSGETLSTGRLYRKSTPGRRGMLLAGGVAGAEPPHKGGPNRPDRPKMQRSAVCGQRSVFGQCIGDGCKGWTWPGLYSGHAKVRPHSMTHTKLPGSVQFGWWERPPTRGRVCFLERPRNYAFCNQYSYHMAAHQLATRQEVDPAGAARDLRPA